jgi:hypothetical protein
MEELDLVLSEDSSQHAALTGGCHLAGLSGSQVKPWVVNVHADTADM